MKKIIQFAISPGGVKKHVLLLSANVDKNRFKTIGIFSHKSLSEKWIKKGESEYKWFFDKNNVPYYILEIPRNINLLNDIKYFFKLIKILREEKPDVLHCHSSKPGILGRIAGKLTGVKIILYTPHSIYFSWQKGIKQKFFLLVEKILGHFCNYIIAVSNSEKELLDSSLQFNQKTIVVNNGIELEKIDNLNLNIAEMKKKENISTNLNVLLTLTRLSNQKDTLTLLKAIKIVKKEFSNFILLIAGNGEEKEELEEFVKKNQLEKYVKFLGWREDIFELISISDIGILSSKKEGLPYALLEFAAFKKPLIGSNTTGIKDCIIHNKNGYLFPIGDYKKLADYLLMLLKDKTKRISMGENGRRHVEENFNIYQMIEKLELLYDSA